MNQKKVDENCDLKKIADENEENQMPSMTQETH